VPKITGDQNHHQAVSSLTQATFRLLPHNGCMKLSITTGILFLAGVPLLLPASIAEAQRNAIDQATGAKGVYTEAEDTYKVTFPRTDVKVTVEGRPMSPFLGFSSWAAFTPTGHGGLMVMGDVVLLEDEVNPAMSAALDAGLEVTALHNHFFYESPRVMYMHIGGDGTAEQLAPAVRKVLDAVKGIRAGASSPAARFSGNPVSETSTITAAALDTVFGVKGETNGGMYKATIGRTASMHGAKVGKQMGVNTWAAFAGSDDYALVDGDFAMTKDELQGVLKALRKAGINIVAIHNHMTNEEPQYVFLHYWGKGPAAALARGLKAALDRQPGRAQLGVPPTVLFVCEHGAAKSVIAAAEFDRLARQRGLSWRASFRGTNPEPAIAPSVAAALAHDGLQVQGQPSPVTAAEVESATQVVTFSTKLPFTASKGNVREWNDVPPVSADLNTAREDIRRRVALLMDELAPRTTGQKP